jgi:hypothetical protein
MKRGLFKKPGHDIDGTCQIREVRFLEARFVEAPYIWPKVSKHLSNRFAKSRSIMNE